MAVEAEKEDRTWWEWLTESDWTNIGGIKEYLVELYRKTIATFWQWYEGLQKFFWGVVDYCLKMVWDFGYYIYNFFLGEDGCIWGFCRWLLELAGQFLEQFPNLSSGIKEYSGTFKTVMTLVGRLDQFLPLTESFSLLLVFGGFIAIFLVGKFILKLIPTVG
jgi:hypothetical protein